MPVIASADGRYGIAGVLPVLFQAVTTCLVRDVIIRNSARRTERSEENRVGT